MAILFAIRVLDSAPTTFASLKVEVSLENTGPEALEIPSPDDTSGALTIDIRYPGGKLLRSMNGLTRQLMQSSGRVSAAYSLAPIEPGQTWRWTLNLAKYHYTLPAGEFEVEGRFEYPPLHLQLRSERQTIRVASPSMQALEVCHDNPVIERLDLLLGVGSNGSSGYYLRQHGGVPLAASYSELLPVSGEGTVFCASANFFQTVSFDPVLKRWLVWTDGKEVRAFELQNGALTGEERGAQVPEGRVVLRSAYYTEDDRLFLFLYEDARSIESWELLAGSWEQSFRHRLSRGRARDALVRVDAESIHILTPGGGLNYERLTHSGDLLGSRQVFRSRLMPRVWQFDVVERVAAAVFCDGSHGRAVELFGIDFRTGVRSSLTLDTLGLRSPIREWSVALDRGGRFHLLVSTGHNRLYYIRQGQGPVLVAEGEERFLPMVVAKRGLYLGCYRAAFGYRFLPFSNVPYEPKFVRLEQAP